MMVIFACSAIGFDKSHKLQQHVNELENLKHIFVLIKKEIQYTKAPLSEIFLRISKKTEPAMGEWLKIISLNLQKCGETTFQEIWEKSIEQCFEESRLCKREQEELIQVGKNMGYIEAVDLYLEQLEDSIEQTREEARTKKKLYQSIGIMSGFFLVIVLL